MMEPKEQYCIMPECPYCPACQFGQEVWPEWVETADDMNWATSEWRCHCTKEDYIKYINEHQEYEPDDEGELR